MPPSIGVQSFFSPPPSIAAALSAVLTACAVSVKLAMYDFTNFALAAQVKAAQNRGCSVQVILDRTAQRRPSSCGYWLAANGVPVFVPALSGTMHHKFLIADALKVATGSYNWTATAETGNFENAVIITDSATAAAYAAAFASILAGCSGYQRQY